MWERLAAFPEMEYSPKRLRSSKFDSRRRQTRNIRHRDVQPNALVEEREVEAEKQDAERHNFFSFQQDPVMAVVAEPQRLRHRRQVGATADVTILNTAVVSVGVDASGIPTTTYTTTLPTGLSTTLLTSSTSEASTSTASSPSLPSVTSISTPTTSALSSSSVSTPSTSAESTAPTGTVNSSTQSMLSAPSSNASSVSDPASTSSTLSTTSETTSTSSSLSLSSTSSTSSLTSPSGSLSTSPTTVSGFGFVTSTSGGFIGSTPFGATSTPLYPTSLSNNGTTAIPTRSTSSSSRTSVAAATTKTANSTSSSRSSTHSMHSFLHSTTTRSRTSHTTLSSTHSHSSHTLSSVHSSSSSSNTLSSSSFFASAGSPAPGAPGAAPTSSSAAGNGTAAAGGSQQNQTSAGVIAGSVVGSVAGFAFILLLLLYFLRWYRRRRGITGSSRGTAALGVEDPFTDPPQASGTMTQRSSTFFPAAAMGFFSRLSRHQEPEPQPQERGFQKISGRKLPSQFSPGMEAGASQGPPQPVRLGQEAVTLGGPVYASGFAFDSAKDKDIGKDKDIDDEGIGASHEPPDDDTTAEVTRWYRDSSISTATAVPPGTGTTGMTQLTSIPPLSAAARHRSSSAYSVDTSGRGFSVSAAGAAGAPPLIEEASASRREQLMPSPARTPTVHHAPPPLALGGPGRGSPGAGIGHGAGARPPTDSPPLSPTSPPRGTLGRSRPSMDGSRGSRFTEGVE